MHKHLHVQINKKINHLICTRKNSLKTRNISKLFSWGEKKWRTRCGGVGVKPDCLKKDLGLWMGCLPWGSFYGFLARIYANFGENLGKLRTAKSRSATGVWTWHLPSSSFERYHSASSDLVCILQIIVGRTLLIFENVGCIVFLQEYKKEFLCITAYQIL